MHARKILAIQKLAVSIHLLFATITTFALLTVVLLLMANVIMKQPIVTMVTIARPMFAAQLMASANTIRLKSVVNTMQNVFHQINVLLPIATLTLMNANSIRNQIVASMTTDVMTRMVARPTVVMFKLANVVISI
jgi:hypothetical protein